MVYCTLTIVLTAIIHIYVHVTVVTYVIVSSLWFFYLSFSIQCVCCCNLVNKDLHTIIMSFLLISRFAASKTTAILLILYRQLETQLNGERHCLLCVVQGHYHTKQLSMLNRQSAFGILNPTLLSNFLFSVSAF